jgi:ribosomal protein S18 acetylase RimI-like enzyme
MDTNFRIAENSDTETLVEFIREFHELEHLPFDDNSVRTMLAEILNDDSLGRVWLIQERSKPIGYIVLTFCYSLEFQGRDGLIDELYIRESHRGQGIGTSALQFVEGVCPSLGIQALHLEVDRKNTAAQSLYRKVGFEDHDRYLMTKWIAT